MMNIYENEEMRTEAKLLVAKFRELAADQRRLIFKYGRDHVSHNRSLLALEAKALECERHADEISEEWGFDDDR
jgi:hypothetical protein